ncbi:lipopolysaccharide heptosyltransferase I [soil metagenome]
MRILIVKLGSIGDIIHTLPTLAAIRKALPDAHISWVAEQRSSEILRDNPMIDDLIEIDTRSLRGGKIIENILLDASKQIRNLRQHSYDLAIDFQGLLKSAMIAKLSCAKRRFGFDRSGLREPAARVLYSDTATPVADKVHVIRKNLALAAFALEIDVPTSSFDFPIATSAIDEAEAETIINQSGGGRFALLNPAGGWVTKLWHPEKFGALADRIWEEYRLQSIVATGPKESELAHQVAASSRSGKLTVANPSLKGFYETARRAAVYIGGDTGPTHIAVAAKAPVVGLFGPTEWWRNGSPNPDDICVERTDISCRVDCHRRTCSNWICMDTDVETVYEAVKARLDRAGRGLEPSGVLLNK